MASDKPLWHCTIETPPKDPAGYTVGELFNMTCEGASVALKEPLKINLPKKNEYTVMFITPVQISENKVTYMTTAYRPGTLKYENIDVVDSEGRGFIIDKIDLKIKSVIDQQKPPEAPFGPIAPMKMDWPLWVFFVPAVVIMVIVAWFMVFLRQRLQKKALERNIKKFQSPMGSYHQFSKDLRTIKRSVIFTEHQKWSTEQVNEFLQKLNESYRLFILREFIVPATTWSSNATIKAVKKKDKNGFDKYKNAITRAFRELDRAQTHPADLKSQDCEQLAQICWQAVDLIWKTKQARSSV